MCLVDVNTSILFLFAVKELDFDDAQYYKEHIPELVRPTLSSAGSVCLPGWPEQTDCNVQYHFPLAFFFNKSINA